MFSYTASRSDSLWKFKCYPNRRVLDLFTRVKLCTAVSAPAAWWHLSWHWHRPGQKSTGTLLPLSPLCWSKFSQAKSFRNSIAYEMEDGGRLNNNVLVFDPSHWFLATCLQVQFFTNWRYTQPWWCYPTRRCFPTTVQKFTQQTAHCWSPAFSMPWQVFGDV